MHRCQGDRGGGRSRGFRGRFGPGAFDEESGAGGFDRFGRDGYPGHPGHRGGGRRTKVFAPGELPQLLLALIAGKPSHGYDLIRAIEDMTGGGYAPSPGVVYPALSYMEDEGLIGTGEDSGSRKTYAVTEAGSVRAEADAEAVAAIRARLEALAEDRARFDPAPVRRAMQTLKMAVMGRLAQGEADRDFVLRLAEVIDEAARKIERTQP